MRVCSSGRTLALIIVGLAGFLALPPRAGAQRRTGVVVGQVKDPAGAAIPDVEITAIGNAATVRSDTAGEFTLAGVPAGSVELSFRRLAFEPVHLALAVQPDDTTEVEVTLSVVAQRLKGVLVLADADRRRILEAFEARKKMGVGYFITRADIVKRNPMMLSDMVRMVPGAHLVPTNFGRIALRFARTGRNDCPPQFYVDGVPVSNFSIDEMPPGDVEGMELYPGAAGVPPEYNRVQSTVSCGTVIIWTRIPGNDRKP